MMQTGALDGLLGRSCATAPQGWLESVGCFLARGDLVAVGGVVLLAAGVVALVRMRRSDSTGRDQSAPPLVFPVHGGVRPRPVEPRTHPSREGVPAPAPQRPSAPAPAVEGRGAVGVPGVGEVADERNWVDAGPVRFERPPEGTLQLLPGRLEIESGEGQGQELRFVRVPGSPPEITFGRNTGPRYTHIQLRVPTVSRLHAHLRFDDGAWMIRNLSSTNPTVVNGRALASGLEEVGLRDGDRIEMGEVVFAFHQPEVRDLLPFRSSWHTDGGARAVNQDAVIVRTLPGGRELAAVCDGMGAHDAGGEASRIAIEALVEAFQAGGDLATAVRRANVAVRLAGDGAFAHEGMGTTLVALLREGEGYSIANVGDSRAYRIDADGIRQVTRDHSFVAEASEAGGMSAEEAARSPWRNAVTRNLGGAAEVEVDVFGTFPATEPHLVVLCTDGIHGFLSAEEIERLARSAPDIRDVARSLCDEAVRRGGDDNVAAAALAFGGGLAPSNAVGP